MVAADSTVLAAGLRMAAVVSTVVVDFTVEADPMAVAATGN